MKRSIVVLLSLLLVSVSLFAAGTKEQAPPGVDNSLQKIMDKGVLVMGLDDNFPPLWVSVMRKGGNWWVLM